MTGDTSESRQDTSLDSLNSMDFPREPVEWHANHETSDIVTFLCTEGAEAYLPPPVSTAAHIEDNIENYQRNTSLKREVRKYLNTDETVESFLKTGWVLSRPRQNQFDTRLEEAKITEQTPGHHSSTTEEENPFKTTQRHGQLVEVNTEWAAKVKDGYSLLIIHPACVPKNKFRVIPTILDMDTAKRYIKVTLRIKEGDQWREHYGRPIAQVIPIPRESLRAKWVVDTNE